MRRTAPIICVLLLLPLGASAGKKKIADQRLLSAQYVCIVSASGNDIDSRTQEADRAAILRVENAINAWGRYHVVYNPENADIVLEVRTGRVAGEGAGGPVPPPSVPIPGEPGPTGTGVSIGMGRPSAGTGPMSNGSEMDVSSVHEDMISIYDARVGMDNMKSSSVLWRRVMAHGLSAGPSGEVPLVESLEKDVDAAARATAKKP